LDFPYFLSYSGEAQQLKNIIALLFQVIAAIENGFGQVMRPFLGLKAFLAKVN
jgi:hypothetical protein